MSKTRCRRACPLANLGTPLPLPQANHSHLFRVMPSESVPLTSCRTFPRGCNSPNRISFSCSLSAPAHRVLHSLPANPVGHAITFAFPRRFWGVNTIRPSRTVTASGSPGRAKLAANPCVPRPATPKDAFDKRKSSQDPKAHTKELTDNWECSTFSALQDTTSYEDWDCFRTINECGVFVRMAWPHLPKNPPDYDDQMKTALVDVLRSFAPSPK